MAYCRNCGAKVDEKAIICPICGVSQNINPDSGSIGYGILGFFFPLVGLILFLLWKDTKPNTAKTAGIGALISFLINIAIAFVYLIVIVVIFGAAMGMSY